LAKQLALETHRDLLTFQVAQQRNMYLGESEKAIQSVFDDYKRVSKRMDNSPILFFNEADSVFGKRTNNQSIVSQTENTIQTILLNELETFEGILICTTNVPDNFDEAFNRRFLMHIVIDNPDEEIRKELVVQIFPNMSESEAKRLASQYTFTAAELGKFKKQWNLQKITGLQKGNLESNLTSFLSQQKNTSKANPIGYTI
jgi:SpoVK/Ycf46/Vps4 family AAA+-type ATPase